MTRKTTAHCATHGLRLLLIAAASLLATQEAHGFRTWSCKEGKCVKESTPNRSEAISVQECKVTCLEFSGLWPQPRGENHISRKVVQVDVDSITFQRDELPVAMSTLVDSAQDILRERIRRKANGPVVNQTDRAAAGRVYRINVRVDVYDPSIEYFTTHADESYKLRVKTLEAEGSVEVKVEANSFFGARHAMETFGQLIFFDDLRGTYKMVDEAEIKDCPAFTHRGIALDTARSYISVNAIKKILDLMAMNKLNTFHWHMTDSQSFPYVSPAYPQLSEEGAYSASQVYTQDNIRDIVRYAQVRGIRVIPEFDAPAHVGEGWEALGQDLITCFKWEPWRLYCVEPPCGQFDPTNEELYDILGTIFKEYVELFPSDLFHMGGDEVNVNCWKSTPRIVSWMNQHNYNIDHQGFHRLWVYFQDKVYKKLESVRTDPHAKPILWSSSLTELEDVEHFLDPQKYIIQIWTDKNDMSIKELLKKKYQLILSNYDELYLDCGGPSWVGQPGSNWCSPYKGWQEVYDHSLTSVAASIGMQEAEIQQQILGSEVALWTEQIDDATALPRLWPRSAALAERLWSNPSQNWKEAQFRMNYHRERLSENFAQPELLQPHWCYQNDGYCE